MTTQADKIREAFRGLKSVTECPGGDYFWLRGTPEQIMAGARKLLPVERLSEKDIRGMAGYEYPMHDEHRHAYRRGAHAAQDRILGPAEQEPPT